MFFFERLSGWWLTYPSQKYEFVSWDQPSRGPVIFPSKPVKRTLHDIKEPISWILFFNVEPPLKGMTATPFTYLPSARNCKNLLSPKSHQSKPWRHSTSQYYLLIPPPGYYQLPPYEGFSGVLQKKTPRRLASRPLSPRTAWLGMAEGVGARVLRLALDPVHSHSTVESTHEATC